jgi:hypothetical protein
VRESKKFALTVALIFFLSAALAFWFAWRTLPHGRGIVLNQPIRLEEGFSISQPFTVGAPGKYWATIRCRKTAPVHTIERALTKRLRMEYSIAEGSDQIVSGVDPPNDRMGYGQDSISRLFASFEAIPGRSYSVTVHITANVPKLAATNPTLTVEIDPRLLEPNPVPFFLSGLLALVGLHFLTAWRLVARRESANARKLSDLTYAPRRARTGLTESSVSCQFCFNDNDKHRSLHTTSPDASICHVCATLCVEVIREYFGSYPAPTDATPRETTRRMDRSLLCTFCGIPLCESKMCVAGARVYICYSCIVASVEAFAARGVICD